MTNTSSAPTLGSLEERFAFLAEASRLLAESLDIAPTLATIARLCVPRLADLAAVVLVPADGEPQRVTIESTDIRRTEEIQGLFDGYRIDMSARTGMAEVIRTGRPAFFPNVPPHIESTASTDETGRRLFASMRFTSFLCVPLTARGRGLGALTLGMVESGRHFSQSDLEFALEVGRRAGVAVDNSQLYAAAHAAIQLRDEFLSVASHELKTPITALSLNIESLRRTATNHPEDLDARLSHRLPMIQQQMRQLTGLVERLLDVSQVAEGRLKLVLEPVDAGALVREVLARYAEQSDLQGTSVDAELPEGLVGDWDRLRIDQVVTNLIDNAFKYGRGRPISIKLTRVGDDGVLDVRDQGIGIPAADQTRLFERYERAAPSHQYAGLGLGLWISRQIVASHGGHISLESTPGQGSRFRVVLPLHPKRT